MGHIEALVTILIWGTTFISTKVLLNSFSPIEILFFRFIIGYLVLWLVCPHKLKSNNKKEELYFASAGLCGITLYYLCENVALTYTLASNVGVIISIAPFFTALFNFIFLKGEKPQLRFFVGFIIAMVGIYLISFSSDTTLQLNPLGDILAVIAAIIWAAYSTITKKVSTFGYNTLQTTRRSFFYGIIFMIPILFIMDFKLDLGRFMHMKNYLNILYLGLGASAMCFVTWNCAVKILGSVKTSVYIYMVPVITTITSVIILHEQITWIAACGIILTLIGLFVSESKKSTKIINTKQEYGCND